MTAEDALAATVTQIARAGQGLVPESLKVITTQRVPQTDLVVSRISYGWSRLGGAWDTTEINSDILVTGARAIRAAYDNGITLFDNADVYSFGKSETVFGSILKQSPSFREKIVIQSKCGVHVSSPIDAPLYGDPHRLDFSYEHIVNSVDGSLRRLGTDHLDILLLHRPDALVEPEEVAKAFDELQNRGKVRYFGVSNHTPSQIALLKKFVRQPLVINQVELGLMHPDLFTDGIDANRQDGRRLVQRYTGVAGTLDYCRLNDIQVQAYSPVRGLTKSKDASLAVKQTMQLLTEMAERKKTTPYALAVAWLLRHPAQIVPIIGASDPKHIEDNCLADRVVVSRQEWYSLLTAATGASPSQIL